MAQISNDCCRICAADNGLNFGAPVIRTGHVCSVRFFRGERFVCDCGKGRSGLMNDIDLVSVILLVLYNDIDTIPTKFQMVSIYVTSGTEQSSEQAITVSVDFHDTQSTMEDGVGSAELPTPGKCGKGWGARCRVSCSPDMYWGLHGRWT
jgi:hypothetical protein